MLITNRRNPTLRKLSLTTAVAACLFIPPTAFAKGHGGRRVIMVEAAIMVEGVIMVDFMVVLIMVAADTMVDFIAAAIGVAVATGAAGDAGIGGTGFGPILFVTEPISVITSIATVGGGCWRPFFSSLAA